MCGQVEGKFVERLNSKGLSCLKGEFTNFDSVGVDIPKLGESNLIGPKKIRRIKIYNRAFFGGAKRH